MFAFNRSNKRSFENETHQKVATLLLDEFIQVISSFELNQIASLTYGTEVCDEIFEMLEEVLGKPLEYTILALQKALVVAKHILIYGSEECVRNSIALGRLVEPLQIYNTVLLQQQRQGATALFYRIKGGGVDKGYPVRDAAKQYYDLVANPDRIHHLRHTHADPNSLVPVGDHKVVFLTDEVRLYLLKKRMDEQQKMQAKSNLAKAEDGFGSGYNSKDGKAVVGAAHGIEEMIARERREQMKYRDDGTSAIPSSFDVGYQAPHELLTEARAAGGSDDLLSSTTTRAAAKTTTTPTLDLLDFSSSPQPTKSSISVDLLAPVQHDLLGSGVPFGLNGSTGATPEMDLLGGLSTTNASMTTFASSGTSTDLLGGGVVDLLGVASVTPAATAAATTTSFAFLGMPSPVVGGEPSIVPNNHMTNGNPIFQPDKKPIMSSSGGNFSALDALGLPSTSTKITSNHLFAGVAAAEQRTLNLGSVFNAPLKDPLSELNGFPDMTQLSLNKPMDSHHPTTAVPKWGGLDDGMSSDSESHGFGGNTMGGEIKTTSNGLTTFGLTATTARSSSSDPFSSLNVQNTTSNGSSTPYSIPPMANPMSLSPPPVMPPPVLPPVYGGMGVGTTYGDDHLVHDVNNNYGSGGNDDDDDGFVMGGFVGSGLQPTVPPPPVPPPPPPAF